MFGSGFGLYNNASPGLVQKHGASIETPDVLSDWLDPKDPKASAERIMDIHDALAGDVRGMAMEGAEAGLAMMYAPINPNLYRVLVRCGETGVPRGEFTARGMPTLILKGGDADTIMLGIHLGHSGSRPDVTMVLNSADATSVQTHKLGDVVVGLASPVALASVLLKVRYTYPSTYRSPFFRAIDVQMIRQHSEDPEYIGEPWDRVRDPDSFVLMERGNRRPTWGEEIVRRIQIYVRR